MPCDLPPTGPFLYPSGCGVPTARVLPEWLTHSALAFLCPGPSKPSAPITLVAGQTGGLHPRRGSGHPQCLSGWVSQHGGGAGRGRAVGPRGCRADGRTRPAARWGCRFSTLPSAGSGQGGPGGCHPVGGGRRQSVGSNDLQREQNHSLSSGPSRAAHRHTSLGQLGRRGYPGNASALEATGKSLFSLTFSETQAAGVKDTQATQELKTVKCARARGTTGGRSPARCWAMTVPVVFSHSAWEGLTALTCSTQKPHRPRSPQDPSCGGMVFPWLS